MRALLLCFLLLVASPAIADCRSDLVQVMQMGQVPYRTTIMAGRGPDWQSMSMEVVPPDRIHFTSADMLPEVIIIGDDGWAAEDGGWVPLPEGSASEFLRRVGGAGGVDAAQITDALCRGEQMVDGTVMSVYSATVVMRGVEVPSTFYADPETGKIIGIEGTFKLHGVTYDYIVRFEYDPTITVVSPVDNGEGQHTVARASIP